MKEHRRAQKAGDNSDGSAEPRARCVHMLTVVPLVSILHKCSLNSEQERFSSMRLPVASLPPGPCSEGLGPCPWTTFPQPGMERSVAPPSESGLGEWGQ